MTHCLDVITMNVMCVDPWAWCLPGIANVRFDCVTDVFDTKELPCKFSLAEKMVADILNGSIMTKHLLPAATYHHCGHGLRHCLSKKQRHSNLH
jgi:hypothetical protein